MPTLEGAAQDIAKEACASLEDEAPAGVSHPDSRSDPNGGSKLSPGRETIY